MFCLRKIFAFLIGLSLICISTILPLHYFLELERESNIHTSKNFENNPLDGEILTLKVPFALPYSSDWETPLESEGLFEHKGQFYTVLSKNYKSDTLYFKCIRNSNAREIFSKLSDNVEAFTGNSTGAETPSKATNLIVKLLNLGYYFNSNSSILLSPLISETENRFICSNISFYTSPFLLQNTPPPDIFS